MIVTDLVFFERQSPLSPLFRLAADFLRRKDLLELPDGEVPLDGTRLFAILQRYETARMEVPNFEYHRRYIDLQYLLEGEEVIGWAPAASMTPTSGYDEQRDICFGLMERAAWTPVRLQTGQLAVFWPEDAHAPRLAAGTPVPVRKIVVKVAV